MPLHRTVDIGDVKRLGILEPAKAGHFHGIVRVRKTLDALDHLDRAAAFDVDCRKNEQHIMKVRKILMIFKRTSNRA
jgi:hypothetical protein